MDELKPCPFCGSVPLLSEGPYDWDGGGRYYYYSAAIECACGLTLEVDNPRPKEYTNYTKALDFAFAAWNRRTERTFRNANTDGYRFRFECCECGYATLVHNCAVRLDELPKYCPNCGAKVVEG